MLMEQFAGPMHSLASVAGVAGVVMAVVYRSPEDPEATDEVALVIMPHRAELEDAVQGQVIEALRANRQTQGAIAVEAGGLIKGGN